MLEIDPDVIIDRYPGQMTEDEQKFVPGLIEDAVMIIANEFHLAGRRIEVEIVNNAFLEFAVQWVVRDLVITAIRDAGKDGIRSISSTTGAITDSVTYADTPKVTAAGILLTDHHRRLLGLLGDPLPSGSFRNPPVHPERDIHLWGGRHGFFA